MIVDFAPLPPEQGQTQNTPPTGGAQYHLDSSRVYRGQHGLSLGSSPIEASAKPNMLSSTPWGGHPFDDNDNSAARCLMSFTKRVLEKHDSPLIHQLPK